MSEIAILGAGNGGCTYAGYLSMKGHDVRLYEFPQFEENLSEIKKIGGVKLKGTIEGFGKVKLITTEISEAIKDIETIMVVVPAFAHRKMAEVCAPHLKEDQIVVLNPGSTFGALEFKSSLNEYGNNKDITIAETSSNMFGCRKFGPAEVNVMALKKVMPVAAIPANRIERIIKKLKIFFEQFYPAESIFETSLNNNNAVVHPVTSILNAGWIESSKGNFDFYWKGMSESVCRVMEEIDNERISVGSALDYKSVSMLQSLKDFYGFKGNTLHEVLTTSPVHGGPTIGTLASPKSLKYRYISEDVPFGLVPYSEVGKALEVETPYMDSLILLASKLNDTDYRTQGRTLVKMGLEGLKKEEIKKYIISGNK